MTVNHGVPGSSPGGGAKQSGSESESGATLSKRTHLTLTVIQEERRKSALFFLRNRLGEEFRMRMRVGAEALYARGLISHSHSLSNFERDTFYKLFLAIAPKTLEDKHYSTLCMQCCTKFK